MANPTITEIYGNDAQFDQNNQFLTLPFVTFNEQGLDTIDDQKAVNMFAAQCKRVHSLLENNADETVPLTATFSVSTPANRNGIDQTLNTFVFEFYTPYQEPVFDPDL